MSINVLDFYKGYEGGDEIQFIEISPNGSRNIIRMWDAFFHDFIEKIKPEKEGWTSLAYYYHLDEGWYDESPWEIRDILKALEQLEQLRNIDFNFEETREIYNEVCKLLDSALNTNSRVYIALE